MGEQTQRHGHHDTLDWDTMPPEQVLSYLVYEIYTPVSHLGSLLNRITGDSDPLTEEEYDEILLQMQQSVGQLSKTVVNLKHYMKQRPAPLEQNIDRQ